MSAPITTGQAIAPDGTRLHVETAGVGEPVLLIQGLGHATWAGERQLTGLSSQFRVVAFDNRGAGQSEKPSGPYSIRLLAEDALAVLQQTYSAPAHVVGCSLGGYVALTLALRHADAVRSLVLISTSAGGDGAYGVPAETLGAWTVAAAASAEQFARQTMPLSFAPGWTQEHPREFEDLLRQRLRHPTPPAAWRAQFAAGEVFLREGLGPRPIRQPALVIHGTHDRVVPYANTQALLDRMVDARLVTLDGAGHLCWLERAAKVNRLIASFVTDVSREG